MNFVYGAAALFISFAVAKVFSEYRMPKVKLFVLACVVEFIAILLLAGIFYLMQWGFFSAGLTKNDLLVKVLGFAAFLGVLVAMKAINTNKHL